MDWLNFRSDSLSSFQSFEVLEVKSFIRLIFVGFLNLSTDIFIFVIIVLLGHNKKLVLWEDVSFVAMISHSHI